MNQQEKHLFIAQVELQRHLVSTLGSEELQSFFSELVTFPVVVLLTVYPLELALEALPQLTHYVLEVAFHVQRGAAGGARSTSIASLTPTDNLFLSQVVVVDDARNGRILER